MNNKSCIIIPTRNEEEYIHAKLCNTVASLPGFPVYVVDGGSTDRTKEIVEKFINLHHNVGILCLGSNGKTEQLNYAFRNLEYDWFLITDADSFIAASEWQRFSQVTSSNDKFGLYVAAVRPLRSSVVSTVDYNFWVLRERVFEHFFKKRTINAYAPLYGISRRLIEFELMPRDVVADDIYFTFKCREASLSVYTSRDTVTEYRLPSSIRSFFRHKLRKSLACAKEIRRFHPLRYYTTYIITGAFVVVAGCIAISLPTAFSALVMSLAVFLCFLYALLSVRFEVKGSVGSSKPGKISILGLVIILVGLTAVLGIVMLPYKSSNSNFKRYR